MKNYLEKLSQKEQMEILKMLKQEKSSTKENGIDAKIWNNAITNVIDRLFGHK